MNNRIIQLTHDASNWTAAIGILVIIGSIWQVIQVEDPKDLIYPSLFLTTCVGISVGLRRLECYMKNKESGKQNGQN